MIGKIRIFLAIILMYYVDFHVEQVQNPYYAERSDGVGRHF